MRKGGLLACLMMATALVGTVPAYAATIAVPTTDDELNEDGDCSLREAVRAANLDTPVDKCRMCDVAGCPPTGDDGVSDRNVMTITGTLLEDPAPTGSRSACVSERGVFDMVGNAMEWVAGGDFGLGVRPAYGDHRRALIQLHPLRLPL